MYYKPDLMKAQQRIEAWWHHEVIDRCCIAVHAPRASSKLLPFPDLQLGPWLGGLENIDEADTHTIERWWKDPEENYKRMLTWFENTLFAGEALPITYINWGSMALAGILGSPAQFTRRTVWYPPVIQDWSDWNWSFNPANNPTWESLSAILKMFIERADGRFLVGPPDLGNGADVLSLMRGMDRLPADLIDNPEKVKDSLAFISDIWISLMEQVHQLTPDGTGAPVDIECQPQRGCDSLAGVMGTWTNGFACLRYLRCDFSKHVQNLHLAGYQQNRKVVRLRHLSFGRSSQYEEHPGYPFGS